MKNLIDFHKTVEAGVDPLAPDREILSYSCSWSLSALVIQLPYFLE